MNRPKLMAEMALRGENLRTLAEGIHLSANTVSLKVNGHRSFNAKEIKAIADYLQITDPAKIVEIFIYD